MSSLLATAVVCPCDGYVGACVTRSLGDAGYEVFGIHSVKRSEEGSFIHVDDLELHKEAVVEALKGASAVVCDLRFHPEASIWLLCQAAALGRKAPATFVAISDPLVWGCTDVTAIQREMQQQAAPETVDIESPEVEEELMEASGDNPEGEQEQSDESSKQETMAVAEVDNAAGSSNITATFTNGEQDFELLAEHFTNRQPTPDMSNVFRAENTILFRHQPTKLLTYIVCPGVIYGDGERDHGFHDYFARAWSATESTALPIFGSGRNIIPTIHVRDLASYVANVLMHLPEQRYLFATDDSQCSQRELVRTISQHIGCGETFDSNDTSLYTQQGVDHMLLDLRMKRTNVVEWPMRARGGMVQNLDQVYAEFIKCRGLQPMKIVINGPPCAGKSALADHLAVQYSLPIFRAQNILAASNKLSQEDANAMEQTLKGGKTGPGRLPANLMAKLCRELLKGVVARNRGFILDGFPKTLREAQELFTDPREWTEEESAEQTAIQEALAAMSGPPPSAKATKGKGAAKAPAGPTRTIDDAAEPRFAPCIHLLHQVTREVQIMLDESDEELQRRCELAGEDQRATLKASDGFSAQQPVAHYNPSDQARRLAAYRDLRAQDEADIEYMGLVAKAKWQLELAKRAEAARKAAEEEHYKRTHCKRIRKLTAVKEVAATPAEPVPTPATEANSATTPESNAACGDPASEESGEPASDEGPTLPTRGGFLAFFESAGTSIVELGHGQSHSPSYQRPSLHAELDALASTVKDVVGRPRNYVGFVNVPEPLSEDTKHVTEEPVQSDHNRSARLNHVLEQSSTLQQWQEKAQADAKPKVKDTVEKAMMRDVLPALTEGLLSLVEERPEDALDYLSQFLINWADEKDNAHADPYDAPIYAERVQLNTEKAIREKQREEDRIAKEKQEKAARIAHDDALLDMLTSALEKHEKILRC